MEKGVEWKEGRGREEAIGRNAQSGASGEAAAARGPGRARVTCVAPPRAVVRPCSPAPLRRGSPSLAGLAPASHSCNLRVRVSVCVCVSLARPLCLCVRERGWGTEAGRRAGREGKKRREAIKHTHTHTLARAHTRPNPPEASGLQLFHVGQQCWQGRRPGAAGSGSRACARGWRLAGAPLPSGAIVGLAGAERRAGTLSFLGALLGLAEPRSRAAERQRSHRRGAVPPCRPPPRFPGGGSLQPR